MPTPIFIFNDFCQLAWIIHESRLPQMQGAVHEAVVLHREWAATPQTSFRLCHNYLIFLKWEKGNKIQQETGYHYPISPIFLGLMG